MLSGLSVVTTYYFNITACDPSNNCNTTGTYNFTTVDLSPPEYSNISVSPPNDSIYSPPTIHTFNVSFVDNVNISSVWIEHNFSSSFINETLTSTSEVYSHVENDLVPGTYYWRMHANDTAGNTNSTPFQIYVVKKIPSEVNLSLNGTASNITIYKHTSINITGTLITPSTGNITLYREEASIASGISPLTVQQDFNTAGFFSITAEYKGSDNYSSSNTTYYVNVIGVKDQYPNPVQAESGIVRLNTETVLDVDLTNSYNLSKTFMKVHHMTEGTTGFGADDATVRVFFVNSSRIRVERYGAAAPIQVSYSILQADNIEVQEVNISWASGDEQQNVTLQKSLPSDYSSKCFVETHRNMKISDTTLNDFVEHEVQAKLIDQNTLSLTRDTEGTNVASAGVQEAFVVCFLDDSTVQTGSFSVGGGVGSSDSHIINSVNKSASFSVISYYQADDGVGTNNLLSDIESSGKIVIHRDGSGSQTALGKYYVISFEQQGNSLVQHVNYTAPGTGNLLEYSAGPFSAVDTNKSLLNCENTMSNGGGTAYTRGYFVFDFNSSNNGINITEGRDRSNTQDSNIMCQVITWPNQSTYAPPPDLRVQQIGVPKNIIEESNFFINITINSTGIKNSENITTTINISRWNGSEWIFKSSENKTTSFLAGNSNDTFNISLNLLSGKYQVKAFVDSGLFVNESNENNNILSVNISVPSWQFYYGFISEQFNILSDNISNFSIWSAPAVTGNMYFTDTDHYISFLNLKPLNGTDDFIQADYALNMTGSNDSIEYYFDNDNDGTADNTREFLIAGTLMSVPITNSTNTSSFVTGLLWDSSYGGAEYNGSQPIVILTSFNGTYNGSFGSYEYEVRVPSALKKYFSPSDLIAFHIEIT